MAPISSFLSATDVTRENAKDMLKTPALKKTTSDELMILAEERKEEELVEKLGFVPCPYPKHKAYLEIWETLTPDQQKEMKNNIKVNYDGTIEIVKMNKKFSLLTWKHNGKDIFEWDHEDQFKNKGIKGITYFTGLSGEMEARAQEKNILNNDLLDEFIDFFPGKYIEEKRLNLIKLFGLEKAGLWNTTNPRWYNVGTTWYVVLTTSDKTFSKVYKLEWDDNRVDLHGDNGKMPSQYLAFENC